VDGLDKRLKQDKAKRVQDHREGLEDDGEAQGDDLHRVRDEGEEDHDEEGLKRWGGSGRTAGAYSPPFGPSPARPSARITHARGCRMPWNKRPSRAITHSHPGTGLQLYAFCSETSHSCIVEFDLPTSTAISRSDLPFVRNHLAMDFGSRPSSETSPLCFRT